MSSSVKTIKLTLILSVFFLLFTYLITVNIETKMIKANTGWISNNFLLTVFGGAFGSTAVVLICELQKYWLLKREAEQKVFFALWNILSEIIVSNNSIRTFLNNNELTVDEKTLDYNRENALKAIGVLEAIDYRSFSGKNDFELALACFFQGPYRSIKQYVSDEQYLRIAVLMDKIDLLEKGVLGGATAKCPNTKKTLDILLMTGEKSVNNIKILLDHLDRICHERFRWKESEQRINSVQNVLTFDGYEKFIERGEANVKRKDANTSNNA